MLPSVETNKLPFSTLFQCYFVSLKSIPFPFFQEEALNDNVMRNYMLINFECFVVLLYYMFDPLVLNDL